MNNRSFIFNKDEKILVGLNWKSTIFENSDVDLMAIMLDENEKLLYKSDLIFYNNLFSKNGSIFHTGDNTTGNFENDDESILVNLDLVPKNIKYIRFIITNLDGNKNIENIGFRIAKMEDIYDNKGDEIYSHKFVESNFHIMYIFEIIQKEDSFIGNICLKELEKSIIQLMAKYNIQVE